MQVSKLQIFFFILVLGFGGFLFVTKPKDLTLTKKNKQQQPPALPIQNVELTAKAAYVWDVKENKALFAKNENEALPLASVTKMMTALTAYENLPPETIVVIKREDLRPEGDSGLLVGERWKLKDLIDYTLLVSSNDGSAALATARVQPGSDSAAIEAERTLFLASMNEKAQLIGLTNARFLNENGLDLDLIRAGAYGSAKDMATLFSYVVTKHPNLAEATQYEYLTITSLDKFRHTGRNTDTALGRFPSLIASKTGFTDIAGGNLVIAFDAGINHPIVISVLGSTVDERFEDVAKLVQATLEHLSPKEKK